MLPIPALNDPKLFRRRTGDLKHSISQAVGPTETDHRDDSSRSDELLEPFETVPRIDVVQHRARGNDVERSRFEICGEYVTTDELGSCRCSRVRSGALDAGNVRIDTGDEEATVGEVERQQSVTTADIERRPCCGRHSLEEDPVIVDVQVPACVSTTHAQILPPRCAWATDPPSREQSRAPSADRDVPISRG